MRIFQTLRVIGACLLRGDVKNPTWTAALLPATAVLSRCAAIYERILFAILLRPPAR